MLYLQIATEIVLNSGHREPGNSKSVRVQLKTIMSNQYLHISVLRSSMICKQLLQTGNISSRLTLKKKIQEHLFVFRESNGSLHMKTSDFKQR